MRKTSVVMRSTVHFDGTLFGILLFLAATVQAANVTNTTSNEERVGWKAGPSTRGTLNLVWSCGITIFACTWTVTHLNLPARDDTASQQFLRKVKWMAINVLFPEFILSKAVCDLRQALDELRQFGQSLPEIRSKITTTTKTYGPRINYERSWEVEYPPYYKILYRCLWLEPPVSEVTTRPDVETGVLSSSQRLQQTQPQNLDQISVARSNSPASLERPKANPATNAPHEATLCRNQASSLSEENQTLSHDIDSSEEESEQQEEDSSAETVFEIQRWTIVHSYFAQMGGIRYKRFHRHGGSDLWSLVTATKLIISDFWWFDNPLDHPPNYLEVDHPLNHLELSREDIEDKSKADWLLKTFAMFQILWLVLNVAVRGTTGLHITQLEIATAAFAVMAVLTYIASWWKPKDIVQPTYIRQQCNGYWRNTPRLRQLSVWLHSPGKSARTDTCRSLHERARVPNDVIWMKEDTSSISAFLAVTSLVFGGIHCVAWNFEFPSRAELFAWRIACVTAAVLPGATLTISILLSHLSTGRFDTQRQKVLMEEFSKLPDVCPEWQHHIFKRHVYLKDHSSWNLFIDSIPGGPEVWGEDVTEKALEDASAFSYFHTIYVTSRRPYEKALKDQLRRSDLEHWIENCRDFRKHWNELAPEVSEAWKRLEIRASALSKTGDHKTLNSSHIEQTLQACDTVNTRLAKEIMPFQHALLTTSRLFSVLSYVVYFVARLLTIVLFLTSLRSVPADVYQVTSWVNLLPKIS